MREVLMYMGVIFSPKRSRGRQSRTGRETQCPSDIDDLNFSHAMTSLTGMWWELSIWLVTWCL